MKLAILALAASANAFTSPSSAARPAATSLKAATATLPATVKPGVVTGDALMDLLAYAKERGFAIPAVNAVSSCGINACLEAAAKREPAYVQFRRVDIEKDDPGRPMASFFWGQWQSRKRAHSATGTGAPPPQTL